MIATVLLCAVVCGVPATLLVLSRAPRQSRHLGRDRGTAGGVGLRVVLAAAPAALVPSFGGSPGTALAAAGVCAVASLVWVRRTARWTTAGHLSWTSAVTAGAAFIVYTAIWTVTSGLGVAGLIGGALLWLLEVAAYLLSLAYLWELVDATSSRSWARRRPAGADADARRDGPFPFVSVHVPTHNEPPEMVLETLRSLLDLDYDDFEVLVLDNNTDDEALWRPVEAFCAQHAERLRFHHLADWPGYKSGALNFGLTVSDPRTELVAVVDADYLVEPHWLRATAPMFADPQLAFVQSPQDYRGWQDSAYYRRLYHSYDYFFQVSQRSRDERDAAIFGGTMGLVRRSALEAVGGWDEWCITEDAELSLRLQRAGWSGRHVDASFGHGVMPLTFEALKGQRFRWCFGGIQILRLHHRSLMPWNRDPDNRLSRSQRLAYLVGGLQWFGDLLGLGFLAFLLLAATNIAFDGALIVRRLSPLLIVVVPVLTGLAILRAVAGVRRVGRGTWREAFGALGIWLALTVTVARACVRGAVEPVGIFLRTPKTRGEGSVRNSLTMNRVEVGLGAISLLGAVVVLAAHRAGPAWLVAAMLTLSAAGYLAAPVNSFAALHADLPARLSRRRSTERARAWTRVAGRAPGRRAGVLVAGLTVAAAAVVALAPSLASNSTPGLSGNAEAGGLLGGVGTKAPARKASGTPSGTTAAPTPTPGSTAAAAPSSPAPPSASALATTVPRSVASTIAAATTVAVSVAPPGASSTARTTPAAASPTHAPTTPTARPTTPVASSPTVRPTSPPGRPTTKPVPTHTRRP